MCEKESFMEYIKILILGVEKGSVVMNRLCERGFSLTEGNSMLY